jgi:hypothetical protein
MEALSLALVTARQHAIGEVTRVVLVHAASGPPLYLHGRLERVAEHNDGVITWAKVMSSGGPEVRQ